MVSAISLHFFNYGKVLLIFLLIIFGVDAVVADDFDPRSEIFDFAINSVLPIIVLIIYNSNKFFKSPYYYYYTAFLLFVTPFLFPFILFRIRQNINTPLWIQIFYAVLGILKLFSTFACIFIPGG